MSEPEPPSAAGPEPSATRSRKPYPKRPQPARLQRRFCLALAAGVVLPLSLTMVLFSIQRFLLYHPRAYSAAEMRRVEGGAVQAIPYQTSAGRQVAFYAARRPAECPQRLWVVFPGNASCALDWLNLLDPLLAVRLPGPATGFLLIDYPSYGLSAGEPTMESIAESSDAALRSLARRWGGGAQSFDGDLNVLGHSLGAATGLQFATRHPVRRLVLAAPFTTLQEEARRFFGWPLCLLLRDRFDNRACLDALARRTPRPAVTIFHGAADEVIPVRMGRELARRYAGWIVYHEVAGASHPGVLDVAQRAIQQAMLEMPLFPEAAAPSASPSPKP